MKYQVVYCLSSSSKDVIAKSETFDEAIKLALKFLFNDCDYYNDEDEEDAVENMLREHSYYIIGYGPESVEIEEV